MIKNPWEEIKKPASDFNVRLVEGMHPLQFYWGKDPQGRYLFVYDTTPENLPSKKNLPHLSGITAAIAKSGTVGKLVLILNDNDNWELFYSLCSDIVRGTATVKDEKVGGAIVLRRLSRWHEFLKKERSGLLSLEAMKGLIGELLLMRDVIAPQFGWDSAIDFWKGPEQAPQDFAVHSTAVEVKCQSGGSKPTVKITSAEQLHPQLPEGFLVVYTLASADAVDPEGFNLNELIDQIRGSLSDASEQARERFEDLVFVSGYIASEGYEAYRFAKVAVRSFKLEEDFPRIPLSAIPSGLERVSFTLKIEACTPFEATPGWWRK